MSSILIPSIASPTALEFSRKSRLSKVRNTPSRSAMPGVQALMPASIALKFSSMAKAKASGMTIKATTAPHNMTGRSWKSASQRHPTKHELNCVKPERILPSVVAFALTTFAFKALL